MRAVLLLLLVGSALVYSEKPQVDVNAKAENGHASGSASVKQAKSGTGIKIGGFASSIGGVRSNGDSGSAAIAGTEEEASTEAPETSTEAAESSTEAAETTTYAAETPAESTESEAPMEETTVATTLPPTKPPVVKPQPKPPVNKPPNKVDVGGQPPAQVPGVWQALDGLRSKVPLEVEEIQSLLASAVPDRDYPVLSAIPDANTFRCDKTHQPGFYADTDFRCQTFRRCDINGIMTSYLCPNRTVFNQITLICDWFFNVDCPKSPQYYDYSNQRLYHENWVLLDTPAK